MNVTYHFNGKTFKLFSDLCTAYFEENGFYPTVAYMVVGNHLYYK